MKKMSGDFIDIHDYQKRYQTTIEYLNKTDISEQNKRQILKFDETLALVDRVSLPRRIRVIGYLINLDKKYLIKDFEQANKDDLKAAIKKIDDNPNYSVWTKQGYRVVIKKFYRWLEYKDEYNAPDKKMNYPPRVSWINCNIRREDIPRVTASSILTEIEVTKMLESASDDVRNEAIIATLYEDGCRIGEHGGVRLKHIRKEGDCYIITVKGKTGTRETFVVKFANILTNWLNIHPYKDDPDAPLWVKENSKEPLKYNAFKMLVQRIAKKAGITKRIYPHIFRHSRATHSIINGEFTTEGAKKIFGWCPDSKMLETYIHLTAEDIKDKYLEKLGLAKKQNGSILDPKICPNCRHPNLFNASICENCKYLLNVNIGIEKDERMIAMRKFLLALSEDTYIKFRISQMAQEKQELMGIIESIASDGSNARS